MRAEDRVQAHERLLLPTELQLPTERHLNQARCLVGLVYLGLLASFLYLVFWLLFSGRIEVWDTRYKVDRLEAPSVAVCPFEPGTGVQAPKAHLVNSVSKPALEVWLYSARGAARLPAEPRACQYDRACVCVDLFRLEDPEDPRLPPQLRDHAHDATRFLGTQGDASVLEQDFQDRVEIRTTLYDPSPDRTLKFGFYDSIDHTPHWVYAHVGSYTLGQLLLDAWLVAQVHGDFLQKLWHGEPLSHRRHIFRYFSQEIRHDPGSEQALRAAGLAKPMDALRPPSETRMSYQMQTFFVQQTIASETALSLYSIGVLCLLFLLRGPVVRAFLNAVFPVKEGSVKEPPRELHWAVELVMNNCCCGRLACWGSGEPAAPSAAERPLLA